jgi:hypothetical protein
MSKGDAQRYDFAMLWNLKFFRPEPLPNRNTKDENKNKKSHWKTSARTKANSGLLCWLFK